jgi:hypothetical protein
MSANLQPFSSAGGFVTAGNISVFGVASPAPTINGFSSVNSENISLNLGHINGGIATVVDDGINSIALAPGAQMDVFAFPFGGGITRGQVTISGNISTTQAIGTWYYQSVNSYTYQLYTDNTYSTLVDASGWTPYTGGGAAAIVKQSPAANIVINSNGFLTKFDNTGNLTLPAQGVITSSGGNFTIKASGETAGNPAAADSVIIQGGNTGTGDGGHIVLLSGSAPGAGGHAGNINITAANGQSANGVVSLTTAGGTWNFDGTGNLTIPSSSGGLIKTVANAAIGIAAMDNGTDNPAQLMSWNVNQINPSTIISTYANSATIMTDVNGTIKTWSFDNSGNLTLPGNTFAVKYANGTPVSISGGGGSYGNANVVANLAALSSNPVSTTGNITAGYLFGNGSQLTSLPAPTVAQDIASVGDMSIMLYDGTIKYNNYATVEPATGTIKSSGNISATGNVQAGNIRTTGAISATGNVTAQNFIGNISITGNVTGTSSNVTLVAGAYSTVIDNTGVATFPGTVTSSGNTNATAFAVVGNGAVSNVALGFFPTGNTPAEMAIRDYSTANSTMYFDTTIGSANTGGSFKFRGTSSFTNYANINQYGVQQPTLPGFRVYGNGVTSALNTTTNTNGVLNGNNWAADYNQGSHLNSTTGVFTAPVDGLYQVNLVARVANNLAPSSQAVVVKNNGTANAVNQIMWEVAANSTVNHFGVSTVSKLTVGDTLTLKVTQGNVTFDVNDNWSVAFLG